ncbi:hypothetical protein FOG18_05330 [Legionella israelensis]|uniref:hypothetical protein n=1 Tax=Legionella israelensis TaxID=454 RepID=UPI001180AB8B|nr:hypothetical protein [Legionella israelensis]QDP72032.1 hypothetical protein FOG18_05330 [Legionella israelensis]
MRFLDNRGSIEEQIVRYLKDSGANFTVARDENGLFLRSKGFDSQQLAEDFLENNLNVLRFVNVEQDENTNLWHICYVARPQVLEAFSGKSDTLSATEETQDRQLR